MTRLRTLRPGVEIDRLHAQGVGAKAAALILASLPKSDAEIVEALKLPEAIRRTVAELVFEEIRAARGGSHGGV